MPPTDRHSPPLSRPPAAMFADGDIEAMIAREARAARLAASAEFLASDPSLRQYREQAEEYLLKAYPGTQAANETAAHRKSEPDAKPKS